MGQWVDGVSLPEPVLTWNYLRHHLESLGYNVLTICLTFFKWPLLCNIVIVRNINSLKLGDASASVNWVVIGSYEWVNARKTLLECVSNGVMSFLHYPIDVMARRLFFDCQSSPHEQNTMKFELKQDFFQENVEYKMSIFQTSVHHIIEA